DDFIKLRTTTVDLSDGTPVRVRPIVPADKPRISEGLTELSAESRYLRFLRPVDHLSSEELTYLTEIDYRTHFAWGAELARGRQHRGIGLARYVCLADDPTIAEAAVAVLDAYQGRGLGGILLSLLAESALENGVRRFRSYVLSDNRKVLAALHAPGIERREEDSMVRFDIPLPLPAHAVRDSALYETLRAVARGEVVVRSPR
ncbi:MAG: GNAT family N-acetyltransferase, partial [Acidimicrobiia bacterium]|nr:GNAT family N-acetyltransferase [Acidimicrobiia bacterium]